MYNFIAQAQATYLDLYNFVRPVHKANTAAEFEEIGKLRYKIYVTEMGLIEEDADHARQTLIFKDEQICPHTHTFYTKVNNKIISTHMIKSYPAGHDRKYIGDKYALHALPGIESHPIAEISKFMILPEHRGTELMGLMARHSAKYIVDDLKTGFGFLSCEPSLYRLYQSAGAQCYTDKFLQQEDRLEIRMVFHMTNNAYQKQINSPLLDIFKKYEHKVGLTEDIKSAVRSIIDQHHGRIVCESAKIFKQLLKTQMQSHASFLKTVSSDNLKGLSRKSLMINFQEDHRLVIPGQKCISAFIVLDGECLIKHEEKDFEAVGIGQILNPYDPATGKSLAEITVKKGATLLVVKNKHLYNLENLN